MLVENDQRINILKDFFNSENVDEILNNANYMILDNDQFLRYYLDSFKHKDQAFQMMDFFDSLNIDKLNKERQSGAYYSLFNKILKYKNNQKFDDEKSFIIENDNAYNVLYVFKLIK